MRRGKSNFPFSVLTNSPTTLEESLALAINFEEIDSCGWSNGLIVVHPRYLPGPGSNEESNSS